MGARWCVARARVGRSTGLGFDGAGLHGGKDGGRGGRCGLGGRAERGEGNCPGIGFACADGFCAHLL